MIEKTCTFIKLCLLELLIYCSCMLATIYLNLFEVISPRIVKFYEGNKEIAQVI